MRTELTDVALQTVCTLVTDGTHDTPQTRIGGFPLIKAKEIEGGRLNFKDCVTISAEDHAKVVARSKPEKGDTLFAHIGASLGEAAYVNTTREFSIKNVALFKPNPAVIHGRYLYYLVISPGFQNLAKSVRTGSAQPFLSLGHLRSHKIRYHEDLTTQRKIAAILSAYDDLIENNLRRIKILEEMAQRLYRAWFVHFRFPGHEKVRMVDSPLGPIPDGWETCWFTDVAEVLSGGTPSKKEPLFWDGEIPFFTPKDTDGSTYVLITESSITPAGLGKCSSELYPVNTVFITARGTVGNVAIPAHPMAMNQSCYALRGRQGVGQRYLHQLTLNSIPYLKKNTGGATFATIIVDTFRRFQIVRVPFSILSAYEKTVAPFYDMVLNLTLQNNNLRKTRDLLLPRLISGELDVSELDIDVPEADLIPEPPRPPAADREATPKKELTSIARKPNTPVVKDPPPSEFEITDIVAAIRRAFASAIRLDREDLLKATSLELGYTRLGKRVAKAIAGGINAAIRRGVLKYEAGALWLTASNLQSQDREVLIVAITSSMRKNGVTTEEELMRQVLVHLGFQRLTAHATEAIKGAIRTAIRRGILESEGYFLRRRK